VQSGAQILLIMSAWRRVCSAEGWRWAVRKVRTGRADNAQGALVFVDQLNYCAIESVVAVRIALITTKACLTTWDVLINRLT